MRAPLKGDIALFLLYRFLSENDILLHHWHKIGNDVIYMKKSILDFNHIVKDLPEE